MQLSSRSKLHSKTLKTKSKNTKNSKKITLLQKNAYNPILKQNP
jgi:hypothetical protein